MTILHEYAFAALVMTAGLRHQSFAAIQPYCFRMASRCLQSRQEDCGVPQAHKTD